MSFARLINKCYMKSNHILLKPPGIFFFSLALSLVMIFLLAGCNFLTSEIRGTSIDESANNASDENSDPTFESDGDKGLQILLCLEDTGAKMYGAYNCGHCANQKKSLGERAEQEFGRVYIECHPNAENTQMWDCLEKKIEVYPTWIFGDGTNVRGFTEPAELQRLSGCTDEKIAEY